MPAPEPIGSVSNIAHLIPGIAGSVLATAAAWLSQLRSSSPERRTQTLGHRVIIPVTTVKLARSAVAPAAFWVCLLALFIALRLNTSDVELNIDEQIPLRISEGMSARGDLDPNWRLADLSYFFKIDQYNFYLYNVVAHGVLKIGAWFGVAGLPALRVANVVFQLLALFFSIDALRRIGFAPFALALAAAFLALAPGMIQDAAIARPESLLYLVVALQIWVLTLRLSDRQTGFWFGLILGMGMAIKVTYGLAVIMIAVPWMLSWHTRSRSVVLTGAAAVVTGAALGFVSAAPYAVIHPDVLLNGIALLTHQYNFGQPPHSLPTYDVLHQSLWLGSYFGELYGLVPLASVAAPFLLKGKARNLAAGFVILTLVLFAYFSLKAVFYERNFSFTLVPVLLAAALAVSALRQRYWRVVAAAVLAFPMGYWSIQIASAVHDPGRLARFEAAHALSPSERQNFDDSFDKTIPVRCETIGVTDFNEPWTAQYLVLLEDHGFRPIARYRSRFGTLVTSTLQTYLDADVHYFRCPESRR